MVGLDDDMVSAARGPIPNKKKSRDQCQNLMKVVNLMTWTLMWQLWVGNMEQVFFLSFFEWRVDIEQYSFFQGLSLWEVELFALLKK
ncbi:hypothetical protein MTR_5g042480 [Medicago truncatula]|uniref:Uncharacterized protein n=1 Tax=Medicago truncatula TaxID=3880 RepID=G7JWJ4_MEDTR|nr:hypothetical protein MTR_5g042480 [Medicago truncatula]